MQAGRYTTGSRWSNKAAWSSELSRAAAFMTARWRLPPESRDCCGAGRSSLAVLSGLQGLAVTALNPALRSLLLDNNVFLFLSLHCTFMLLGGRPHTAPLTCSRWQVESSARVPPAPWPLVWEQLRLSVRSMLQEIRAGNLLIFHFLILESVSAATLLMR